MVSMKPSLKPVKYQVVVITGASSGIGRLAAIHFGELGAKLVLTAKSEQGLKSVVEQIRKRGGHAVSTTCDVSNYEQVKAVADFAIHTFGRIDTWINNASNAVFALAEETTPEEYKRIMEVNVLGYYHGAQVALPYLKQNGGSLIFVTSVLGELALPYLAAYTATKHAVKGFIDTLRVELRHEGAPVNVVNVIPATMNTPFYSKGKSKLHVKARGGGPVYHPDVVVKTLVYAATNRCRDLYSGTFGKLASWGKKISPTLMEKFMVGMGGTFEQMKTNDPKRAEEANNLYEAIPHKSYEKIYGDFSNESKFSLIDWYRVHPGAKAAVWLTSLALATSAISAILR